MGKIPVWRMGSFPHFAPILPKLSGYGYIVIDGKQEPATRHKKRPGQPAKGGQGRLVYARQDSNL